MIREHTDAILALLRAAPGGTPLTVYDGAVPKDPATGKSYPPPYVVVYFADNDPELVESTALTGRSERYVLRTYCHSVGGNGQAARMVADRVRAALLDTVPTVDGRNCFPIRREDGQPPQRDESTGTLVIDKVDLYRLESLPA